MKSALERIAKAVGSGTTVPAHAYVAHVESMFWATDGRQFACTASGADSSVPDFCVKHDALMRALSRDNASLSVNAAGDIVVRYARERGRMTLRTLPTTSVARMPMDPVGGWVVMSEGARFLDALKFLRPFCGSPDGQAWSTGVHIGPEFAFAASNNYFARRDVSLIGDEVMSIPPWAADFILSVPMPPARWAQSENALFFDWGGIQLRSTQLAQETPETAWTIASGVPTLTDEHAVPLGLQETLERAREEGLSTIRIGAGRAQADLEYGAFEESVDIASDAKRWRVAFMLAALEHATKIDLSGPHAFWNGPQCRGMIAGMVE